MHEDTQKGKYLCFYLEQEIFGIEIRFVTEIISIQSVTKLPETPNFIKGIINLRGILIPVIDVRLKFKKPFTDYTDRTCIVVIDTGNVSVGLIVDNVAEVTDIDESNIVLPPDKVFGIQNRYIQGFGKVNGEVILLLDCCKMLSKQEAEQIRKVV